MRHFRWYVLERDGVTPLPMPIEWAGRWWENNDGQNRRVDSTWLGKIHISTVFLGIDHSWDDGPPVLWETMIFGGIHDGYQERYTSYRDARLGHEEAVILARKGLTWNRRVAFTFVRARRAVAGGPRQLSYLRKRASVHLSQRYWRTMGSWRRLRMIVQNIKRK